MTDNLVYLAIGRDDVLLQARYAIATALAWSDGGVDVLAYTDRPEALAGLGERVRPVTLAAETVRAWRGRWDFFYRLKPAVIGDALRGHPGARVLFLDADTFFTGPVADALARIGERQVVMHEREYNVATRDSLQMRNFRRRLGRARFRGGPVELDGWMWNSGAVGLHPAHLPLVDEWLAFVDEVFPSNPKPIVEQYGLSLLIPRAGCSIAPVGDLVTHYYADKERYVDAIGARLAALAPLPPAEAARRLREERLALPPPVARPRPGAIRRISGSISEKARVGWLRLRNR